MPDIPVAVLGASGIGKFHAREFERAGADVAVILGSSQNSAEQTAAALHAAYGFRPRAYADLEALLEVESLDAVSICTPRGLHYDQARRCLAAGLHVLCEKPVVHNWPADNDGQASELVE